MKTKHPIMTVEERAIINGLRARGYAVTVFNPVELSGLDSSIVESAMVDAGNDAIAGHSNNGVNSDDATPARAPVVVQCEDLRASDFYDAPDNSVIVKTSKGSNFRVERQNGIFYIVHGRTEFVGGSTTVLGINAVRALLAKR